MSKKNQTHTQVLAEQPQTKRARQDRVKTAVSPIPAWQTGYGYHPTSAAEGRNTLQRTIGNQALRRLTIHRKTRLKPTGDEHEQQPGIQRSPGPTVSAPAFTTLKITNAAHSSLTAIQRKNGAYPLNFQTTSLTGNNKSGEITHNFSWKSSSNDLSDLSDVLTREKVVFDRAPGTFMPAYDVLAGQDGRVNLNGAELIKTGGFANTGGSGDTHHPGYGPFFDNVTGFVKAVGTLTATQTYQYRNPDAMTWHDIPNSQFAIDREITKEGLIEKWKKWYLKTTKSGQGSSASAKTRLYESQTAYSNRKK